MKIIKLQADKLILLGFVVVLVLSVFFSISLAIMLLWNYVIAYFWAKTIGFGVACGISLILCLLHWFLR
jgi:hypothetical protein